MADGNSKRIKLETKPSVHNMQHGDLIKQLQEEQKRNEQLKAAFKRDLNAVSNQNQELTIERDSLVEQLKQMSKSKVQLQQPKQLQEFAVKVKDLTTECDSMLKQLQQMSKSEVPSQQHLQQTEQMQQPKQLQQFAVKIQDLTTERDSLLEQLQKEISKSEALRLFLREHEQSHQSIVDSVAEQSAIRVQEMSDQIAALTNQCRVFRDEKHNLTEQLDQIKQENTCAICLSPWESQGDHRIVSLPCGHLFGKKCIRSSLAQKSECPFCKQKVQSGNIRYIYGCRILPVQSPQAQPSQPVRGSPAAQPVRPSRQPVPRPIQLAPNPVQPVPRPVQPAPNPVQAVPRPVQPVPNPVHPVTRPVQPALPIHPVQDDQQAILRMPAVVEQQARPSRRLHAQLPARRHEHTAPNPIQPALPIQQAPVSRHAVQDTQQPAPHQHLHPAPPEQLARRGVRQTPVSLSFDNISIHIS